MAEIYWRFSWICSFSHFFPTLILYVHSVSSNSKCPLPKLGAVLLVKGLSRASPWLCSQIRHCLSPDGLQSTGQVWWRMWEGLKLKCEQESPTTQVEPHLPFFRSKPIFTFEMRQSKRCVNNRIIYVNVHSKPYYSQDKICSLVIYSIIVILQYIQ